jgi:hypothetical protein
MSKRIHSHQKKTLSDEISERLGVSEGSNNPTEQKNTAAETVNCVHCGIPFVQYTSTGGEYGICQSCVD